MNAALAIARWCLRFAARRWPSDVRDSAEREWAAELDAISRESDRTRLAQAIGSLRFGISLAISPPVPDEHGVPRGWRELLPGLGRTAGPYALLFVVALVVSGPLSSYADGFVMWIASVVGVADPFGFVVGFGFTDVFAVLVMVGAGWWLGRRAARAPGRRGHPSGAGRVVRPHGGVRAATTGFRGPGRRHVRAARRLGRPGRVELDDPLGGLARWRWCERRCRVTASPG